MMRAEALDTSRSDGTDRVDPGAGVVDEVALVFGAPGAELVGVLARPWPGRSSASGADERTASGLGVVIVVGGPQTRVGSHRQFVQLARAFARAGMPCLRFDYTGMGDSGGPLPDFEQAGPDLRRACDALQAGAPDCKRILLWGLCDGASTALMYAPSDARVAGVIAANPWARSDATRSAALVGDHYAGRLRSPEFWKKLFSGRIDVISTAREALGHVINARRDRPRGRSVEVQEGDGTAVAMDLPSRLARALSHASIPVHLQLSGQDLTASEFEIAMKARDAERFVERAVQRYPTFDHTFSGIGAWDQVILDTIEIAQGMRGRLEKRQEGEEG